MKLGPRSLAGQMLLLIGVALIIAQGINFAMLLGEVRSRRATFTEGGAIARTVDTVERMHNGLPIGRPSGPGWDQRVVTIGAPETNAQERDAPLEARVRNALREAGYPAAEIRASREQSDDAPDRLLISARLQDGRWVNVRSPLPPGDAAIVFRLIGQTVVLLITMLIAVIVIGRNVASPLRRLTSAAQSFGTSGRHEPVPLGGPGDVQRLITTYNQMQSRILDMLTEKDRMLGAIGHDLRTPLASLRLRAEAVADDEERQRMIATIEEMVRTLDDILSLARLGRSTEAPARTNLSALVDALVQDLQDLGSAVTFDGGEQIVATVRAGQLRRALRNLVENSVKYGKQATVSLAQDGGEAVIAVDDKGPGIPEDALDHVMDGFVRLDESRNRAGGGTGIGLTIARSIVSEHGGSLQLANRPEGGLRAMIRLPLDN